MDSATPLSPSDLELAPLVLPTMDPSLSSSPSSTDQVENVNQRFESVRGIFNRCKSFSCDKVSEHVSCLSMGLLLWYLGWIFVVMGMYRPENVWIGPNSSILVQPNSMIVQSIKVEEIDETKPGLQLFGFYKTPPLDVLVNWSESRLLYVSSDSYKGWPYYLNKGTSFNISYTVEPQGSSVHLGVNEGNQGIPRSLNEASLRDDAWSWNTIQGSGMIQMEISETSTYYIYVANLKRKDVKVEMEINVRAVLYDCKESFYKCSFTNGKCSFNTVPLTGSSVVLTSPAMSKGSSIDNAEWEVRLTYVPRLGAFFFSGGIVISFMLLAIHLCTKLQCGDGNVTENESTRTQLLSDKDDDDSSTGSCDEPFANDDSDLESTIIGNDVEEKRRRRCAICFDAPKDCFYLPCGHCASCYQCGTKMAETSWGCPICRRKIKKVNRVYTV